MLNKVLPKDRAAPLSLSICQRVAEIDRNNHSLK